MNNELNNNLVYNSFSRYQRLQIKEVSGLIIDSSIDRMNVLNSYPTPKSKEDVLQMLGDQSSKYSYTVFVDNDCCPVKTVAVGK